MPHRFAWILPALLALACLSCSAARERRAPSASLEDVSNGLAGAFFDDGAVGEDLRGRTENLFRAADGSSTLPAESPAPPDTGRMMIYRGAVTVEVARVEDAITAFVARVTEWGGHLGSRQDATVTVRVPAGRFDEAMALLRGTGRVLSESMQAEDVGRQHLDTSIRLENARTARTRLLALLDKADKVEDILKIEEQLRRLTEEIERMEGELKWLADQVAMSTIAASFRAVAEARPDRRRRESRFDWINRVGVDALRRSF